MPVRPYRFAARWSLFVWIITVGVIAGAILAVGAGLRFVGNELPEGHVGQFAVLLGLVSFVVMVCVAVFFAPLAFSVYSQAVVVNRMGPDVVIACDSIREATRIGPQEVGFPFRLGGSGGFFGVFGRFYSRPLGHYRAYTTNRTDLVLLTLTDGTNIVLSPGPADAFLDALARTRLSE